MQILSGVALCPTWGRRDLLFKPTTSFLINPHPLDGGDFDHTAPSQEFSVNALGVFQQNMGQSRHLDESQSVTDCAVESELSYLSQTPKRGMLFAPCGGRKQIILFFNGADEL
jgi:hypothetical protein